MNGFRKCLIVCFVVVLVFLLSSVKTWAHRVSSAEGSSIPSFHPDAWVFLNTIWSFPNWTGSYYVEDLDCQEKQYKRMDLGGRNDCFIDSGDIHYLVGHGAVRWDGYYGKDLSAIIFKDGNSLVPSEARNAWGDTYLEWIGFRIPQLLNEDSADSWAKAMNGVHLILGFKTNCYAHNSFGKIWAQKMRSKIKYGNNFMAIIPGQHVAQAWFSATDATQPGGTTARVIGETQNNYEDHLWGNGPTYSQDPCSDEEKWLWDHTVPSPICLSVNGLGTMKVYEVVPRDVNEAYVRQIGTAFGLAAEPVVEMCDSLVMADLSDSNNPKILEVSRLTGHFNYHEDGKLFAVDPNMGRCPNDLAHEVAESFLTDHGLLPDDADAVAYSVEYDTITEENIDTNEVLQTFYQNTNVGYGRQIFADSRTKVSVAGAGARVNAYIGGDGNVMGARGNWRNIQTTGDIAVNDANATWALFETYGEKVAIEPVLVEYDDVTTDPATAIQVYYEYSSHIRQTELIPCWMFEVEYSLEGESVGAAKALVPAAHSYVPPVVEITTPATSTTFNHGDTINFDCDVVAGFGTPPYSYNWQSRVDGLLSTQKAFQTDQLSVHCPDESLDCSPLPHAITAIVTDAKDFHSTDTIQITVNGPCDECADPADLDRNKKVDFTDFAHWASRFLTQSGSSE